MNYVPLGQALRFYRESLSNPFSILGIVNRFLEAEEKLL